MDLTMYRDGLRLFIKDLQDLNRLLKFEQENEDKALDLYLNMALGFLNGVPPPIASFDMSSFPVPSLLIHQGAIECLISNSIVYARNTLQYNNGGVSVKIVDGERYNAILQQLYAIANREIEFFRNIKVSINIEGCWGGVNSPYQYIAGYPYLIRPYNGLQG
jgi:hypothetical protein